MYKCRIIFRATNAITLLYSDDEMFTVSDRGVAAAVHNLYYFIILYYYYHHHRERCVFVLGNEAVVGPPDERMRSLDLTAPPPTGPAARVSYDDDDIGRYSYYSVARRRPPIFRVRLVVWFLLFFLPPRSPYGLQ